MFISLIFPIYMFNKLLFQYIVPMKINKNTANAYSHYEEYDK